MEFAALLWQVQSAIFVTRSHFQTDGEAACANELKKS
jgi:hypothetical protein